MRRFITVFLVVSVAVFAAFASSSSETPSARIGVMQGPTGFSSVMLPDTVEVSVYPSPNEAMSRIVSGELDMAVLPANTAVNLYNKGVPIKMLAIVGEGMLSIVGTDEDYTTLAVPGAGGTPDQMATFLYPDAERSYSVTAPAQVAQLLIAGKCDAAIIPQPFVNMALSKNSALKVISNVQEVWKEKTGLDSYPMSVLVVRDGFDGDAVAKAYRQSIEKVLDDPDEAARRIGEKGIMTEEMARISISDCALVYKDGRKAKNEMTVYLEALGLELPDDGFYLL